MYPQKRNSRKGVTLIELMVTIVAAVVLIIAISAVLAYGHMGYNRLYRRANSEVVRNAYEARRIFDRAVRKATIRRADLSADRNQIYVYYFSDPLNTLIVDPDRYARFYISGAGDDAQLLLERGQVTAGTFEVPPPALPGRTPTSTAVIAHDVTPPPTGTFSVSGAAVKMVLTLDNDEPDRNKTETLKMNVTTTAIRHNW